MRLTAAPTIIIIPTETERETEVVSEELAEESFSDMSLQSPSGRVSMERAPTIEAKVVILGTQGKAISYVHPSLYIHAHTHTHAATESIK